jgi:tetratricopeptide (TPR) repeat protein
MARKKIAAKREPDIFQRTFMGLFEQLSGVGLTFTAVLVGLLLVMALLWGFSSSREKADAEAWKKLTAATEEPDLDRRVKKLEKLVEELSGTGAHATASVLLAALLHEQATSDPVMGEGRRADRLGRCRELYREFLDAEPTHPLALKARADLARVIEDLRDYAAAEEAYAAAAAACQDTELSFMQGELLWGQARCALEQGRQAEAQQFLETALARASGDRDSEWVTAARQMHDSLRSAKGKSLLVDGAVSDEPAAADGESGSQAPPEGEKPGMEGGEKAP